jgi:hypothetical protein
VAGAQWIGARSLEAAIANSPLACTLWRLVFKTITKPIAKLFGG